LLSVYKLLIKGSEWLKNNQNWVVAEMRCLFDRQQYI